MQDAVQRPKDPVDLAGNLVRLSERRFYANLAWSIVRFWFTVIYLPGAIALIIVAAPAGFVALLFWAAVFIYLQFPASVGDKTPEERELERMKGNRNYW